MDVEAHFDEAVDHLLDLRFRRALLHYYEHCFVLSALFRFHAIALDLSHFIDDSFKHPLHGVGGERAARCATSRCRIPGPPARGS